MKKNKIFKLVSLSLLVAFIFTQAIVFSVADEQTENSTQTVQTQAIEEGLNNSDEEDESGMLVGTPTSFNGGITPFAAGDTITVDGVNYTVLTEGTVSEKGTVEVGNNTLFSRTGDLNIPATILNDATQISYDVVRISNSAFNGATGLQGKVTIPSSVTLIGNSAFKQSGITGLSLPSEGEIVIDISAFDFTVSLTGPLTIPGSVKSIGHSAFINSGISSVDFQEGKLTTIGDHAFENLGSFGGSINIPASVTTIGDAAFAGTQITSLTFTVPGENLTIGVQAFFATHIAGTLIIPERVVEIKDQAFSSINDLNTIVFENATSAPTIGSNALLANSNVIVFYPADLESEFRDQVIAAGVAGERHNPFNDSTARIIELSINGVLGTIDENEKKITVNLTDANIDVSALTPEIKIIGDYVTPDPTTWDFTVYPGEYTVRSRDSLTQELYTVFVNAPLSIKTQPENAKAVLGDDVEFKVEAFGAPQKFQWQSSSDGVTWNDITGEESATTNTLKVSVVDPAMDGTQYRCKVYNDVPDEVLSNAASLEIGTAAQITIDQESITLTYGYDATSSETFNLSGNLPISVSILEGDAKITWNQTTKQLDIAAGLNPGFYPVTLVAENGFGAAGTIDFYVIVMEDIDANDYPVIDPFIEFNGTGDISVRIDGPFSKFSRILINGEELDGIHYTVSEGSTIITLKEEYLKTLPNGKYTLTAIFFDGMANTEFVINVQNPVIPNEDGKIENNISTKSASTGDSNQMWILISLLSLTAVSVSVTLVLKKKNN